MFLKVYPFLSIGLILARTIKNIRLKELITISESERILAPRKSPKYEPQSVIKVEKSASKTSSLSKVVEVLNTFR